MMLPHLLAKTADVPRESMVWAAIAALVAGQLVAIGMLCSYQVRKAEVRSAALRVERTALADCLRYVPNATLNSCATRVSTKAPAPVDAKVSGHASMSSAMPVGIALR